MRAKLRQLAANFALLVGSVLACLLFFEFVVFGLILKPDDVLPNVSVNGVVRYQPNTRAIFRHPDGTPVPRHHQPPGLELHQALLQPGQDAGRAARRRDRRLLRARRLRRSPTQGFPEVIERQLNAAGVRAEVLRFGMDGAPLSQYLHMLRREVRAYQPDVVVVQLIHNDFDESYRFLKTRYASSFLKIGMSEAGRPWRSRRSTSRPAARCAARASTRSATSTTRPGAYLQLKNLVSRLWWGGDEEFKPEFISSAVDIRRIADHAKNRFFARYVLSEMKALSARGRLQARVRHGWRARGRLRRQAARQLRGAQAQRHCPRPDGRARLPFLDLQATFADRLSARHRRFEFPFDWHWNVLGNELAGEAIAKELLSDRRLLGARPAASTAAPVPAGKS